MNNQNQIEKIKKLIEKKDELLSLFNMKIIEFSEGSAKVRMKVMNNCLNAAAVCHGGALFSLSDVAFALASNSHGNLALALDMSISFIKAVPNGETITAHCMERQRGRRTGRYIIEVTDTKANLVALVKATAFIEDKSIV